MRAYAELDDGGVVVALGQGPSMDWEPGLPHWQWVPADLIGSLSPGWAWTGAGFQVPPAPTWTQSDYVAAVQYALDVWARTRNYDGILSLCTYATDTDPVFRTEGQAGVEVRSRSWRHAYGYLSDVQASRRQLISPADLVNELPAMVWP